MNAMRPLHELREWIAEHLDPLHDHASQGGLRRSDFDLNETRWADAPTTPPKPAAVLIGLVEREHGVNVLLTRRSDTLRSHTGQVASWLWPELGPKSPSYFFWMNPQPV